MLKMKLQYFGHLMWRVDSLEKTLMLGGIGGRRRRVRQRVRWLDGTTDSMNVSLSELREMVMDMKAWRAAIHRVAKIWKRLSNWTEQVQGGYCGVRVIDDLTTVNSLNGFFIDTILWCPRGASLLAQMVKNLPAIQEAWVRSLGQKDPWEKGTATPVFFPGEFHGQRNLTGYSPWGCKESDTAEQLTLTLSLWRPRVELLLSVFLGLFL